MNFDLRLSIIFLFAGTVCGQNLVQNPHFEMDANNDKSPDSWLAAGDSRYVEQTISLDTGLTGSRCAKLVCNRVKSVNAACHAMPGTWSNCGLQSSFYPESDWAEYEFLFQATRDCAAKSRLQIWYNSTGTLWVDDIAFYKTKPNLRRPGNFILPGGSRNSIPNASFECGRSGWGSSEWDRTTHWGGKMNRLFGEIDTREAYHGKCCLRIGLSKRNQPISYFDYYDLHRTPIRAPLAANVGWLEVEPGKDYTFSVYLKAAQEDTLFKAKGRRQKAVLNMEEVEEEVPAVLAVRQFEGRSFERSVRVGRDWQRYSMTFQPGSRWCYVVSVQPMWD